MKYFAFSYYCYYFVIFTFVISDYSFFVGKKYGTENHKISMYLCTTELFNLFAVLVFLFYSLILFVIKSHKMTMAYLCYINWFFFRHTKRNVYNQIDEIQCIYH